MNIHQLDGTLWLAAGCKLLYYANESCKTCASVVGLFVTCIVVAARAWNALPDRLHHVCANRRIISYSVEDVSIFPDLLTLTTCVTLTL